MKMESTYSLEDFLRDHCVQLETSGVPKHLYPRLHEKLKDETMDAGSNFELSRIRYVSEEDPNDVTLAWQVTVTADKVVPMDSDNVYLIDHAWSFQLEKAQDTLRSVDGLLDRVAALVDYEEEDEDRDGRIAGVMRRIWSHCRFYQVSGVEEDGDGPPVKTCVWYLLDEFGSRIQHNDEPACRIVPLYYIPRNLCYSIVWITRALDKGDEVTVDMVENVRDEHLRPYRLLPWLPRDFSEDETERVSLVTEEFFGSHRMKETLPLDDVTPHISLDRPLRVFSEMKLIRDNLTHPRFTPTDNREDADILWLYESFKDYLGLSRDSPNVLVNQFPSEGVVTVKDLLAALSVDRPWYPLTYNLVHELPQFVTKFQQEEEEEGNHNVWIVKPWNLGRGMGIVISDCLDQIIRLVDTEPRIVSKYVCDPVLFYREDLSARVKFDVRYMVLLRSVKPLKLFVYKTFWLRFANKEFSLENFEDYEKHFTVMNYREDSELRQVNCEEFVPLFDGQYPHQKWSEIETRIHGVLKDVFSLATTHNPPMGIAHSPQSRGMYAVDLLLEWRNKDDAREIQPVVCEVNFCPDCTRACLYHPHYFNDVFATLVLDEPTNVVEL